MSHIMENIITVEGSEDELKSFIKKHYKDDRTIDFASFGEKNAHLDQVYTVDFVSHYRFMHIPELFFTPEQEHPEMIAIYYLGNRQGPGLFYDIIDMYPNLTVNYYSYFDEADMGMWIDNECEDRDIEERWEDLEDFCATFNFDYLPPDDDY